MNGPIHWGSESTQTTKQSQSEAAGAEMEKHRLTEHRDGPWIQLRGGA